MKKNRYINVHIAGKMNTRNGVSLFILFTELLFVIDIEGLPRHQHNHQIANINKEAEIPKIENASSRSYIDIDASDPFKVPKGSHYVDQTLPNFDEEAGARAMVENREESPDEENDKEENNRDEDEGRNREESAGSEEAANIEEDIPDAVKEKLNELSLDSKDGKPIEINEKDLKSLLNKDGNENQK